MHLLNGSAETHIQVSFSDVSADSISASQHDLDQIWSQNVSVPDAIQGCVHNLIAEIAESQPDALAVCAWDGDFTYSQLDTLADEVARRLIVLGVSPKSSIPILFSKSRWTCIAMLGVIKAGCAALALDPTQPDTRLRSIVQQAQPRTIVSSAANSARAPLLADVPVLQLDDSFLDLDLPEESSPQRPIVSPSDIVYISFTSGTTGQPKGACISHANVRSAVHYQGEKLGFHRGSRVFDFAPYSFDVAWSNFLHTLCAGGCICISSEQDMLNDLSSAINAFNATLINVTPTVLRTISPIPPSLQTVLLSGEMPYRENVTQWAGHVRLLNCLGPTECTFKCAFSVLSPSQEGRPDVGTGVGFCTWIVDPNDGGRLVSKGSIGELYLEGPLVGQGYLSDPEKTASAFINDPPWLLAGSSSFTGRGGRLYKTGDLVKYKLDGRLLFVSRKDSSQLKIRGQRVEIGDVEHHVRACLADDLPVIADVILPRGSDRSSLALFVPVKNQDVQRVKNMLDSLAEKLLEILPAFMVPSVYFPVDEIPLAHTGKVDRRRLREMGSALSWEEIVKLQSTILSVTEYCEPSNDVERQLRRTWAKVLDLDTTRISTTDSFLRLGGDSVAAMHMVAAAREKNLSLTVADVFRTPILSDLARVTKIQTVSQDDEASVPFSLLNRAKDKTSVREEAARLCGVEIAEIQDVYPCTPLQQGMLAMTARNEGVPHRGRHSSSSSADYVSRTAFELPGHINIKQFGKAWIATAKRTPITRTRIIDLPGEGLVQVVVNSPIPLHSYPHISASMEYAEPMGLGTPLCRAGVVRSDPYHFVLEMHHAIFDGWCTMLILDAVEATYHENQKILRPLAPFQPFIQHVLATNSPKAATFWREQLAGSEATVFPSPNYHPKRKLDLNHSVSGLQWLRTGITPSSVVRSALTMLLASYTNSNDVKYGATVSGRQAPVPGIERIAGPTIATIPVRVKFDWDQTVEALLEQIQRQAVEVTEHEQFGLQHIQRIDEEVEDASQFQLLLVVQPVGQGTSQKVGGLFSRAKSVVAATDNATLKQENLSSKKNEVPGNCKEDSDLQKAAVGPDGSLPTHTTTQTSQSSALNLVTKYGQIDNMGIYNSYAMMIICQLEDSGLTLKINFDSGAIEEKEVQRIALQLEHLLRQFCSEQHTKLKLRDIPISTKEDLIDIWGWNRVCPEAVVELVTDLIDSRAVTHPEALAVSAWDRQLTYQQLKDLSICLACRLREEGVGPGSIVVLSFEKSSWLTVSMISVLKVGGVALPMSAPTSSQRAREVVENLQPRLAITSSMSDSSPFHGLIPTFRISELVEPNDESYVHIFQSYDNLPSDPALILFTSGSTGAPKSILWRHATLSSNIRAAGAAFGLNSSSRVFQFAGYEFDVSTVEALSTLSVGGCLCIPLESDRTNRLAGAISDANANWMCLTPSVSESLAPGDIPSLRTLVFAGEKLQHKTAFRWAKGLDVVYNWFGPAEASVATSYTVKQETWKPGVVGRSTYGLSWLVDPKDHNTLAPVGAIAELCIEGPILASYVGENGSALNEKSFFSPPWLQCGHHQTPGRDGPLYKTGDLVKYDTDGRIIFIGRSQDSQRKLRGQRVELTEIELRVQSFLSGKLELVIVAEIFPPSNSDNETLALFISPAGAADLAEDTETFIKRVLPVDKLEANLLEFLPSHMIPKLYIPITKIPTSHAGKTDRRRLRQIGSSLTYEQLAMMQPSRREARKPSTVMEKRLQQLWAEIIGIEADSIDANDNFLRLGGDSISAMRLVASARNQGLRLTVADVFRVPQLENMAKGIKQDFYSPEQEVLPFSLLGPGVSEVESRSYAARLCSVPESQIVDVYPCTALQEGLLALGTRRNGQYVSRSVLRLQIGVDTDRLQRAWLATVQKLPILRTRIIDLPGQGLVQVVLDYTPWRSGSDVDTYLREDEQEPMGLGTELCRATIINRNFIFTIHHCTYDGNSLKIILDELESQYLDKAGMTVTPFQNFIQHLSKIEPQEAASFWREQLSKSELRQFPVLPAPTYEPQANEDLEHSISLTWPRTGITPSTIIRSAWAILASQYVSSSDVIFGVTVSGRQADMRGLENCVAPTISTVPIAVSIDWDDTIEAFLRRMQRQTVEITPYEQYGLQNIQRAYGDLHSGLFQTLLVVQPVAEGKSLREDSLLFKARSFSSNIDTRGTDPFNTHALMLICELTKSGLHLQMSFDNNIIDKKQIHRIACQFEAIMRQMCMENIETMKLDAIQTASDIDLELFWTQNAELPEEPTSCVHDLITLAAKKQPNVVAIDAWDGQFLYREVDELSTVLCRKLIGLGVSKGSIVALCFEKSKWTPLAQIAVFKAGAVTLLQSVSVPNHRVGSVFKNIGVQLALASESRVEVVSQYARCFTIDRLMEASPESTPVNLPVLEMSDPAAILVSSGSTGEPKQILWSHRTIAANVKGHGECVSMNRSSRVFQFVSYDFDVATIEMMSTLVSMGCLCIPSESERLDGMAATINRFGANYINITPSTAKLLHPESVPSLSTFVFAGENLAQEDVHRWKGKCRTINFYGPCESASAAFCAADVDAWHSGVIRRTNSKNPSLCWLVDPRNHNKLVPFGAVGEIALEGPTCANGYIGNPTMTERLFRKDPTFLTLGNASDRQGRHGLIYRTGDLARYDTNGDLIYLGRKDAQVKIRGQLIAPEEVEYHIRRCLALRDGIQVVVDAILPESGSGSDLTLVAFISSTTQGEVERLTTGLNEKLKTTLPQYAIPSYYIPISDIPTTPTGKRDHTRLQEIGASFNPPRQAAGSKRREPITTAERTLRELWSLALGTDADTISTNDSFLRVGDSIQAMRLVGIARQQGLLLKVADIFQHPILEDMAKLIKNQEDIIEDIIGPFTLLDPELDTERARQHAASLCVVSKDEIEDLFPCTQLQEGLLALTIKRQGDYTGHNILELAPSVDPARFKEAWERVVATIPILRTRIIDLPGQGLVQVVTRGGEFWTEADGIDDYLSKERELPMGLGSPLMRCGLFPGTGRDSSGLRQENLPNRFSKPSLENKHHINKAYETQYADHEAAELLEGMSRAGDRQSFYFALTMHHSIYDGVTTLLVLETLESLYNGATPLRHCPFQSFAKYISSQDRDAEAQFWKAQFVGIEAAQFPALPSSMYKPQTDSTLTHAIEDIVWRTDDSTPSTIIRAAWAFICSQYSNSSDVVFGTVVAGRKAPVGGIERVAGPTIATLPIRVKIDGEGKIPKLIGAIQNQATEMIQYEQTGLSKIRQINGEAEQACQFQTLVVVQPQEQNMKDNTLFVSEAHLVEREGKGHRYHGFNSYALTVVCTLEENRLRVEFCFDSAVLEHGTMQNMAQHFEQILRKLCSRDFDEVRVCDINMTTNHDLDQIWKWNSEAPESIDRCLHDLITEVAQSQPNAIAVSAWDGELTYGLLNQLSSTIAYRLIELGVERNMIVPLCFEKSMFSLIALLSVIKAGGAGLLLDPTLPELRLNAILQQVKPILIISSPSNEVLSSKLVSKTLVLGAESELVRSSLSKNAGQGTKELPYVDPSDLLYVIFTSGSTGIPKCCLIEHRNFSSAVHHQRTALRLNNSSRMYDFSSYTFDATYWSAFHVLAAGGTFCIPSEEERKSNLTDSIRRFHTTDVFLTPSTARLIDATKIPTLRNVHLGGEEVTKDDVTLWMPYANTFISYGPAEASAGTLYWNVPNPMPSRLSIGKGVGVSTWIVDPLSSARLSPIGTVGELYLEGPLVGKGYLGDEEKTASSFLENPTWLCNGAPNHSILGRDGRLYKTGDLVKYDPADGSLIFVGRKDTQVKLRGQRIELSEVEHHVRYCLNSGLDALAAVAEVVVPNATGRPTLVVFIQLGPSEKAKMDEIVKALDLKLPERLPSYMVPGAYVAIESVPMTAGGKTDRRHLRHLGANLTLNQWSGAAGRTKGKPPSTESELRLQKLWTIVLGVPADEIGTDSSFLRLSGDSISAMRLTALALSQGISLTVQNIFNTPRLSEMAKAMTSLRSDAAIHGDAVIPFSLLKNAKNKDTTLAYISKQCNTDASHIEDVFPCTGVQKSLLSMTAKSNNSYVAKYLLWLKEDVDVSRLKQAWENVSQTTAPILRYRIVDVPTEGLVQVQLNEPLEWDTCDSVETYLEHDQSRSMGLSKPLTRLAIVGDTKAGGNVCLLTQHHAIYDGYSLNFLLKEVSKAYLGVVDNSPVAPFQAFIKYVVDIDEEEAKEFWRREFAESEAVPFPPLPDQDYQPKADSTVRRDVTDLKWPNRDATASTIIRTAWSILTARYTDSEDVVFGAMVTGRQAPLAGIDRMIAPLIAALPVRVKFDPKQSVNTLLSNVQKQSIAMIAYEQTELLDIRRINADTERGSRFNTLLVVQPAERGNYMNHSDSPFQHQSEIRSTASGLNDFNPNAVMIMCQLTNTNGLHLEISFDSKVIDSAQMERITSQFEHVLRQLCTSTTQTVEEIDTVSVQDVRELWRWNASVPGAIEECVHDLIANTMKQQPQAPAICSWDGNLSYAELDDLSSRLASHLVALGVGRGTIIPLCFEKSLWYSVAALGTMKAGAACVAMDSTQPEARLRSIVKQVNPKLILSSATNEALASRISESSVVIVDRARLLESTISSITVCLPKVHPSDVLYVVFTSGSTGVPKGVVTTHENFASAATHQAKALHIKRGTRVFDFVSYNFDVSWSNTLQTLICGGCLCVPSEWQRRNDIPGSLNRMNSDYVYFTPSVARSLEPSTMPGIRTLAMGGEPIQSTEVSRWRQAETIIGIYGPAEAAQALSFIRLNRKTRNNQVGHSFGARTWLVQPGCPDRLAAIGTIGELLIEGPTVSKGYFGDPDKTTAAYIRDPIWLPLGSPGHPGRHGRLYKTGDLLRYNSDGSLEFIGRKDGMIKLRGQRIELGEVEYHVRSSLHEPSLCAGIAAEIIMPQNSASPILAVFVSLSKEEVTESEEDIRSKLTRVIDGLEDKLSERVPQYMIPGAYIHVDKIPMTTTNKTDRRVLRELGNSQTMEKLAELQSHGKQRRVPSTVMEKRLQSLWSSVLGIEARSISAESSFLRIGGESIAAMRLVSAAREQQLSLTVADIFKAPRLSQLALLVTEVIAKEECLQQQLPFSLLKTKDPKAFLQSFVEPVLGTGVGTIKDVIPTTDFQERAISDALQDPPSRYPYWILDLPADVDFSRLEQACHKLVDHFDILHTVFIQANGRFWQVLLSDFKPTYDNFDANENNVESFTNMICEQDLKRPRRLGRSFVRFMAVKHRSGKHKLVFRISHAQFDGFSWGLVLQTLSSIYSQKRLPTPSAFGHFIGFNETKKEESLQYWTSRLQRSSYPSWSSSDSTECAYDIEDRLTMKVTINMPNSQRHEGISTATVFHAACAVVLSQQFQQREVVLGRLVTGRSMLPTSLQNVVGPCMTEVPIRINIDANDTISSVALQLQNQFIEDSTHEASGMAEIIKNCTDWPDEAKDFGWRTAFQQEEDAGFTFLGSQSRISFYESDLLPRTRPEIYATPREGELDLVFEGNRRLIGEDTVRDFLARLQIALSEY